MGQDRAESEMSEIPIVTAEPWMLTLEQFCRVAAVPREWVVERVQAGLIECPGPDPDRDPGTRADEPAAWRFDAPALRHTRSMRRIELGFDAPPELAALVADLEDEISRLRALLARGIP